MLEVTRVLDAPPGRVFKAWSDPEQVKRWWGPNGFTTPVCTIDFHPGGAWHYCMHSPEGRDYWCKGVYSEIVEGEKIVTTDFFSDEVGNLVPPTQYGMSADWPDEMLITVDSPSRGARPSLPCARPSPIRSSRKAGRSRDGPKASTGSPRR